MITTHTTFIDDDFQSLVARLQGPALLIADEVHHLGAERSRTSLPDNVPFRLALSATPDRWMDEVGTHALRAYFSQTVFQFTLAEAIARGVLVPYLYYPILVDLTEDEIEEYRELTHRIVVLMNSKDPDDEETLAMLLIKRAKVLNNASEKLPALQQLIGDLGQIDHALVYCSPEQISDVQRALGWDMGLLVTRFTAEESSSERQDILTKFDQGSYQALVAMKCLDEGVDVPSTRTAFIMASSGNPREFIQRRGRILRRSDGKHEATIYDFVAVPSASGSSAADFNTERSIMRRELARYIEFAASAKNRHTALDTISNVAKLYGITV